MIKRGCAGAEVRGQTKKGCIFLEGEVFFLLTCPLMGDPNFHMSNYNFTWCTLKLNLPPEKNKMKLAKPVNDIPCVPYRRKDRQGAQLSLAIVGYLLIYGRPAGPCNGYVLSVRDQYLPLSAGLFFITFIREVMKIKTILKIQ